MRRKKGASYKHNKDLNGYLTKEDIQMRKKMDRCSKPYVIRKMQIRYNNEIPLYTY